MPEKTKLNCPCGELIRESSEESLVAAVQKHLAETHPDLDYTRDEILLMAY